MTLRERRALKLDPKRDWMMQLARRAMAAETGSPEHMIPRGILPQLAAPREDSKLAISSRWFVCNATREVRRNYKRTVRLQKRSAAPPA